MDQNLKNIELLKEIRERLFNAPLELEMNRISDDDYNKIKNEILRCLANSNNLLQQFLKGEIENIAFLVTETRLLERTLGNIK